MGDMGDTFRVMKQQTKAHRARMLEQADLEGWARHTDYHFSRTFDGKRIDWWPSGGKAKYDGKMIYGHRKVNSLIERLKNDTA